MKRSLQEELFGFLIRQLHEKTGNETILYISNFTTLIRSALQIPSIIASVYDNDMQGFMSVFHAATVTFETTNCVKIIQNHLGKGVFIQVE